MKQQVVQTGATVIVEEPSHPAARYKNAFMGLGVTQVVIGFFCVLLGGIALAPSINWASSYAACGLWSGGWFITSGALAIATSVNPNNCNVVAGMIIAILASLCSFGIIWYEAGLALVDTALLCFGNDNCQGSSAFTGLHATVSTLAGVEFIIAIVHASFCCCGCGSCCGNKNQGTVGTVMVQQPGPVYTQAGYNPPQQQVYVGQGVANPQFGLYAGQ